MIEVSKKQRRQHHSLIASRRSTVGLVLLLVIGLGILPAQHALAANTLTVTTTADNTTVDGQCSLREALTNVNNAAATFSDCAGGTGTGDTIDFNIPGGGTITITGSTLPDPIKTVTIDGTNGGLGAITISGGNAFRIFNVPVSTIDLTLNNITLSNGVVSVTTLADSGAGIKWASTGTLTLTNSIITGNHLTVNNAAGAAFARGAGINNLTTGTVIVTNSAFSNNVNTAISGSSAAQSQGGGLANQSNGNTTILNSTFSGNSVTATGATGSNPRGGGFYNNGSGTVTITNSTFSGNTVNSSASNTAGGGGIYTNNVTNSTPITLYNTTITGNTVTNSSGGASTAVGGGLWISGIGGATLHNTIISGNTISPATAGAGADINGNTMGAGGLTDADHNILGDLGPSVSAGATDISTTNPQLGPLADNTDPTAPDPHTFTRVPLAGSPAIGNANNAVCTAAPVNNVDQNTYLRVSSGDPNCDIGAAESLVSPLAADITYAKVSGMGGATGREVTVNWSAVRESNALGYDLYAGNTRLNTHIIPAHSTLGGGPINPNYSATVSLPAGVDSITIRDIAPGGKSKAHGPYKVGTTSGKQQAASAATQPAKQPDSTTPAGSIKLTSTDAALSIAHDGIYHLTYEALTAQGINLKGVSPARLALTTGGKSVGIYVQTAKAGKFGPGDWIEFVATAQDDTYNSNRIYVLTARPNGKVTHLKEAPSVTLAPKPGDPAAQTVNRELPGRFFYWASAPASAPAWDWAFAENDVPQLADQNVAFDLPRLYNTDAFAGQNVTVTLHLRGWGGYNAGKPDHHTVAQIAGVQGEVTFTGNDTATISLSIPASALSQGSNNLRLQAPGDLGFEYDTFLLESLSVSYPQATALPASLTSVASARTYTRLAELTKEITAQAKGKALDYLIIANSAFVTGVQPLAAQHRAEKMRVAVVDANAIYDAYGDGSVNPDTLKAAIAAITKARGAKYVLLVGADSIDPRDYAKQGDRSFIPAYHAPDSQGTRAPSDAAFAPAGVALGRLPVTTTAELSALVLKTRTFGGTTTQASATFVSDPSDPAFAAMTKADAGALPQGTAVTQLTWTAGGDSTSATQALISQWQKGSRIIGYTGHSNAGVWADDDVLDASQLAAIAQGKAALVAVWGCWAASYDGTFGSESLSQQLLALNSGGAAAVIASSTEVNADDYAPASKAFYAALYAKGKGQRIGDAFVAARKAIPQGSTDLSFGLTLLGDPAARIS